MKDLKSICFENVMLVRSSKKYKSPFDILMFESFEGEFPEKIPIVALPYEAIRLQGSRLKASSAAPPGCAVKNTANLLPL